VFKRSPEEDFDTPSQLATELDGHKKRFETGRQNVLSRATRKVAHLSELEKQTIKERQAHEELLKAA
jgi:hypothetical protein